MSPKTARAILKIAKQCNVEAHLDILGDVVVLHCDWYNESRNEDGVDIVRVTSVADALLQLGF
jgi:hypothetical protein